MRVTEMAYRSGLRFLSKAVLALCVGLGLAALFLFFGLDAAGRTVPFLHGAPGAVFAAAQPALSPQGVRRLAQEGTNNPPTFLDPINLSVAENTPRGENVGDPLTATDVDNDTLTYSLGGTDAASFNIDAATGQIKTKAALDYETKNTYTVRVTATDPAEESATVWVNINVTDVDEAGRVTLSPERPRSGMVLAATLTDPDGRVSDEEWQWARSDTQARLYANITGETGDSYTPVATDVGKYLQATVSYTDRHGSSKLASSTKVRVNSPPVFPPGESRERSVAENTLAGEDVGDPVTATDDDDDTLTYSLGGADAGSFRIEAATGQLKTKAPLDYEARDRYTVMVTATDLARENTTVQVNINVTDVDEAGRVILSPERPRWGRVLTATLTDPDGEVSGEAWQWARADAQADSYANISGENADNYTPGANDVGKYLQASVYYTDRHGRNKQAASTVVRVNSPPVFTTGDSGVVERTVAENTPPWENVGDPVTATDVDGDTLAYSLGGADADSFSIEAATGQLWTRAALDYETRDSYTVMITATDQVGEDSTVPVNINVADVEEAGQVTLSPERPRSGLALTATLTDPDGEVSGVTWQWDRAEAGLYAEVTSATAASYTPVAADVGKYLRATASYTDRRGSDKRASSTVVQVNSPPVFPTGDSGVVERTVAENTPPWENVGEPLTATDANAGDSMSYSLGGADAESFSIVTRTGQIRTKAALDYETRDSYTVRVTATDQVGEDSTVPVNINVTDVEEAGQVTLSPERPRVGTELTATLTDPDDEVSGVTWQWARADAQAGPYADITSATTASYTLVAADVDKYLRVTASYTDRRGPDKRASSTVLWVNSAPVFPPSESGRRSVAENTPAGENVGEPLTATDANAGDIMAYSLGGADADSFSIEAATGQVKTKAPLDYEVKNSYSITVSVSDGKGSGGEADTSIELTVSVTDVPEPPGQPAPPWLRATSSRQLTVTWNEPVNTGPAISGYDLEYRQDDSGDEYTRRTVSASPRSHVISNLSAGTAYEVRGRAKNADGPGEWSSPSSGHTSVASQGKRRSRRIGGGGYIPRQPDVNQPPVFTEGESAQRHTVEGTAAKARINPPVTATDPDGDPLSYWLTGAAAQLFKMDRHSGQLATRTNLGFEMRRSYIAVAHVSDGRGGSDAIVLNIAVADAQPPAIEVLAPVPAREGRADAAEQAGLESESVQASISTPTATAIPIPTPAPTPVATATPEPTPTPTKPPEALALAASGPPPSSQTLAEVPMSAEPGDTGGWFVAIVRWFGLLPSWVFWLLLLLIVLLPFLMWALNRRREQEPAIPPPFVGSVRQFADLPVFEPPSGGESTARDASG